MTHWMIWLAVPLGILSTAVVFGTDMFFLTIGRAALRQASETSVTEVMGFFHLFADARMPIWGILAILSNILLAAMSGHGLRRFYVTSVLMLILFVVFYARFAKPINRIQTEAAQNDRNLANSRELQASWDRLLLVRVPLLLVSLLAQSLVLLIA
jgi:glucan phosphoethanolaminetransferase (alkaline phosphatase superfamily)